MSQELLWEQDGQVLRITLNRPAEGNLASDDMARDLIRLLGNAGEKSKAVVLRGAGADFCIGRSVAHGGAAARPEAMERRDQMEVVFACYSAFRQCEIPIVGIVQGRALGYGCALAGLCDITLAANEAKFQIPEMLHNIMPTMVMSALIDRMPRKSLAYLVYSTEIIDAREAQAMGLVSRVVPAAELEQAERTLLARLVATPPPAVTGVKEYLRTAADMPISGAVDFARNIHATVNSSSRMKRA
jgi:enoyl-CoA hydratase